MATYMDPERRDTAAADDSARRISPVLLGALTVALAALMLAWYVRRDDSQSAPLADTSMPMVAPVADPAPVTTGNERNAPAPARAVVAERAVRPLAGNPVPRYPRAALRNGSEGDVVLNIVVGTDGRPMDVQVVERSGTRDRAFDRAAIQAARQWRFEPALRDGEAVPATVRLPIEFRQG